VSATDPLTYAGITLLLMASRFWLATFPHAALRVSIRW